MLSQAYGKAFFCEDIRLELGDKFSYMGILGPEMVVAAPQKVLLPKLCVAVHFNIPSEIETAELVIRVFRQEGENEEMLVQMGGPYERNENMPIGGDVLAEAVVHIIISPFPVENDCRVKVRAYLNDEEYKIGTLPIRLDMQDAGTDHQS